MAYFERLEMAVDYLVAFLQAKAPKETGNLTMSARKAWDPQGMPYVVIGGELAPYAVYTNEPWLSPAWHGAVNPNEEWVQMACEEAKPFLIAILSGEMTQEEYNRITGDAQFDTQTQFDALAIGRSLE